MKNVCVCWLLLALAAGGCATRSQADAKARTAFMAGQQQALARAYELQRTSIRIIGNVKNPLVEWAESLTLAQAIVAADYQGVADPGEIIVIRNGQPIRVDPKRLLGGEDFLLQSGDTVEIRP
jgi:hypothetical protein